jgi:hypothetical protein
MAWLNIFALLLNLGGVGLLFRFGIPYKIDTGGQIFRTISGIDTDEIKSANKYKKWGYVGIAMISLSTAIQIIVSYFTVPSELF